MPVFSQPNKFRAKQMALTLQLADVYTGIKLRQILNFAETMVAQKITGIGSLLRSLSLFPEFAVKGQPPRATVRLI